MSYSRATILTVITIRPTKNLSGHLSLAGKACLAIGSGKVMQGDEIEKLSIIPEARDLCALQSVASALSLSASTNRVLAITHSES